MKKNYIEKIIVPIIDKENNQQPIEIFKIESDKNGNPRYVIHFLSLDIPLENYHNWSNRKKTSLKIYTANWFGGGYVLTSYSIERDLQKNYNLLHGLKKDHGLDQ